MGDISLNSLALPLEESEYAGADDLRNIEEFISPTSWKRVFHYAYSLVRDRAEAEDITQEAFVILFQDAKAGRRAEHLGAWMRGVTRHLAYRFYRESRADPRVSLDAMNEQASGIMYDLVDPAPSAEKKVIEQGLLRLSAEVVYEFPEKDRECILMYFRGYDFLQIAAILGVSRWTARRTTLKALKKFQTRIDRSRK
jgi:RNA polymerase sigma-70 factor (ECF subfamily)